MFKDSSSRVQLVVRYVKPRKKISSTEFGGLFVVLMHLQTFFFDAELCAVRGMTHSHLGQ